MAGPSSHGGRWNGREELKPGETRERRIEELYSGTVGRRRPTGVIRSTFGI